MNGTDGTSPQGRDPALFSSACEHSWSIEDWIRSKRRNRLGQYLVELLVCLPSGTESCDIFWDPNMVVCTGCFHPRWNPEYVYPSPEHTTGKRKPHTTTLSLNLHTTDTYIIEKVTTVDNTLIGNHSEAGIIPLTATRFQTTIRGWGNKTQHHRVVFLLDVTDDRMITTLRGD